MERELAKADRARQGGRAAGNARRVEPVCYTSGRTSMGNELPDVASGSVGAQEAVAAPGGPHGRRAAVASGLFIALFLAFQVAMPLRYYLTGGGSDERFSWRMFSTLRMQRCEVEVDDVIAGPDGGTRTRPAKIRAELHSAWINLAKRGRHAVVDKMLARRCARDGVQSVQFTRRCTDTDGTKLEPERMERRCASDAARGSSQAGTR